MSNTYKDSYESRNSGEDMADIAMQNYLRDTGAVEYQDYSYSILAHEWPTVKTHLTWQLEKPRD